MIIEKRTSGDAESRQRILIVDDTPSVLNSLSFLFDVFGIDTDEADSADTALARLESVDGGYPVVVIDGLDGACWRVCAASVAIGATAILNTADPDIYARAVSEGLDIVSKYDEPEKLIALVQANLR